MAASLHDLFRHSLNGARPSEERYVPQLVDAILSAAQDAGASDVHLIPDRTGLQMDWRIDGVLHPVTHFPGVAPNVVARLKVLSQLLTYRTDVPQEGRLVRSPEPPSGAPDDRHGVTVDQSVEMRVSTFPTLYGEKAVIRLFVGSGPYRTLNDLGLAHPIAESWRASLGATNGVLLISGPAGSGKTTTLYASLREILESSPARRSLVSLEDPIEAEVSGVAQSQINAGTGFDYARGLRSILRQDPEVIMVGEIRDRETAETVFQASLTGHLVLTSFHAGSSAEAVSRVSDLGVEPYLLRSGLLGILSQRLLRRLCSCARASNNPAEALALPLARCRIPAGCDRCAATGYSGRVLVAELFDADVANVAKAILVRADAAQLEEHAVQAGMIPLFKQACAAAEQGETSPAEVRRVFGVRSWN